MLTEQDIANAARSLGCSVAIIKAFAEVESKAAGFLPTGEPTILFEPHIFSRLTGRRFDRTHPDLSYPVWRRGAYGSTSSQHAKLQRAAVLNREAALQSCSWGRFQVMGFNWEVCGYPSLQAFINDMYASEQGHLRAFIGYLRGRGLVDALRRVDIDALSFGYNGSGYKANGYDVKLRRAYLKWAAVHPDFSNVVSGVTSTEQKR